MAPGHHERLSLVFATSDDGALTDLGQELAPAFFINLAPDTEALFRTLSEQAPEIVVVDLDTIVPSGTDVFEWTALVRATVPETLLIIISRAPLRSARQRAKKAGADEFLLAPVDFSELREYLLEAGMERRVKLEAQLLREDISQRTSFCGMIGGSEAMHRVYEALRRVGPSNTHGDPARRKRDGEGAGGARDCGAQSAAGRALHQRELRCAAGNADGVGAVRS